MAKLLQDYPTFGGNGQHSKRANMPALQNVRGKIYLLDRITPSLGNVANGFLGAFGPPIHIPDNATGQPLGQVAGRKFDIFVQDQYNGLASPEEQTKLALFKSAVGKRPKGGILLNFASATKMLIRGVYIQKDVVAYLDHDRPKAPGWCLIDYPFQNVSSQLGETDCIEMIIASNFNYGQRSGDGSVVKP